MALQALVAAGCCLLAACGSEPAPTNEAAADNRAGAAAVQAANATAPATNTAEAARDLAFEAEGLRLVDTQSGAARPLPFGMAEDQLLALLESFRGPADGGTNSECPPGPLEYAAWADGLTLYFNQDRFSGWALDQRAEGAHTTMSGIGPGSTRSQLDAAYEVEIETTTLGTEFIAGGMGGLLDGAGPDARITAMWAGDSCVFR